MELGAVILRPRKERKLDVPQQQAVGGRQSRPVTGLDTRATLRSNRIVPILGRRVPLQRERLMKSHLAIAIAVLAVTACMAKEPVTAKLVGSRPGSSMTGMPNTICTYRYSDVRGDHEVEKIRAKDATCPPTIKIER